MLEPTLTFAESKEHTTIYFSPESQLILGQPRGAILSVPCWHETDPYFHREPRTDCYKLEFSDSEKSFRSGGKRAALKHLEEVICRINSANSALFAGLIRQIVPYLPD